MNDCKLWLQKTNAQESSLYSGSCNYTLQINIMLDLYLKRIHFLKGKQMYSTPGKWQNYKDANIKEQLLSTDT